jgi:DNA-binding FrmR family transcriptional regulator
MLLASVRGGINNLMAEVLEDHIRLHLLLLGRVRPGRMNSVKIRLASWAHLK